MSSEEIRSFDSWSVSDPFSFDSGFGWWEEFWFVVVGVDSHFPRGVVDDPVVVSAEQDAVG